jgi:transcription antitermination factor NusG
MEHIVRREIEKTNHGAFVPTYAKHWKVDGRQYSKEFPLLGGYVFFLTKPDDWAGIPDIHGVYRVLSTVAIDRAGEAKLKPCRVSDQEMNRLVLGTALNRHTEIAPHRYTKYYRPSDKPKRKSSRKPRPGKRIRNIHTQ